EVIQVGEVRVVASSSVTSLPAGGVAVDGQEVPSPMMVLAIGDPSVMEPALKIPGGAADSVAADGGAFSVTAQEEVRVGAVAGLAEQEDAEMVKRSSNTPRNRRLRCHRPCPRQRMDWPWPVPPRAGSVAGDDGVSGVREHRLERRES